MNKCRDCHYFVVPEGAKGTAGKCHRYPAQNTVVLVPARPGLDGQPRLTTLELNAFPNVEGDTWCGEWKVIDGT